MQLFAEAQMVVHCNGRKSRRLCRRRGWRPLTLHRILSLVFASFTF